MPLSSPSFLSKSTFLEIKPPESKQRLKELLSVPSPSHYTKLDELQKLKFQVEPELSDLSLLAEACVKSVDYKNGRIVKENGKRTVLEKYEFICAAEKGDYGGCAFFKRGEKERYRELILVHKGITIDEKENEGACLTKLNSILRSTLTPEVNYTCTFTLKLLSYVEKILKAAQKGHEPLQIITTGIGVGGFYAQISAFAVKFLSLTTDASRGVLNVNPTCISFNSPGALEILRCIQKEKAIHPNVEFGMGPLRLDIQNFVLQPTLLNCLNRPVGELYIVPTHGEGTSLCTELMKMVELGEKPKRVEKWPYATFEMWNIVQKADQRESRSRSVRVSLYSKSDTQKEASSIIHPYLKWLESNRENYILEKTDRSSFKSVSLQCISELEEWYIQKFTEIVAYARYTKQEDMERQVTRFPAEKRILFYLIREKYENCHWENGVFHFGGEKAFLILKNAALSSLPSLSDFTFLDSKIVSLFKQSCILLDELKTDFKNVEFESNESDELSRFLHGESEEGVKNISSGNQHYLKLVLLKIQKLLDAKSSGRVLYISLKEGDKVPEKALVEVPSGSISITVVDASMKDPVSPIEIVKGCKRHIWLIQSDIERSSNTPKISIFPSHYPMIFQHNVGFPNGSEVSLEHFVEGDECAQRQLVTLLESTPEKMLMVLEKHPKSQMEIKHTERPASDFRFLEVGKRLGDASEFVSHYSMTKASSSSGTKLVVVWTDLEGEELDKFDKSISPINHLLIKEKEETKKWVAFKEVCNENVSCVVDLVEFKIGLGHFEITYQYNPSFYLERQFQDENCSEGVPEDTVLEKNPIILVSDPGMGKTTTLNQWLSKPLADWIIFLPLKDFKCGKLHVKGESDLGKAITCIAQCIADNLGYDNISKFLLSRVFLQCLKGQNKLKVCLLCDGFDEMEIRERKGFLDILKMMKLHTDTKIIVSASTNEVNCLESALSVLATQFKPLSLSESVSFSEKVLLDVLGEKIPSPKSANVEAILTPLHIRMTIEIALGNYRMRQLSESNPYESITEIYEQFVIMRYKNYFHRILRLSTNAPSGVVSQFLTAEYEKAHIATALKEVGCDSNSAFTRVVLAYYGDSFLQLKDSMKDENFSKELLSVGVLRNSGPNSFEFYHKNLAQYYIALMLFRSLLVAKKVDSNLSKVLHVVYNHNQGGHLFFDAFRHYVLSNNGSLTRKFMNDFIGHGMGKLVLNSERDPSAEFVFLSPADQVVIKDWVSIVMEEGHVFLLALLLNWLGPHSDVSYLFGLLLRCPLSGDTLLQKGQLSPLAVLYALRKWHGCEVFKLRVVKPVKGEGLFSMDDIENDSVPEGFVIFKGDDRTGLRNLRSLLDRLFL